ncbi:ATP-dependent endonuclease [Methanobrevibacter arboriphilus]|uniref:ATP-dependent nuclease n=1 Tax=Methanobrevibacter arboriphilus TaxID=39441 RepID=UPI0005B2773E|nr:AAA family ATPase [Methanobrevibacter arboriphilus]
MYLEKFKIKNFRLIKETTLNFNPGLNVLIGENNSGKTAIIDALRLCIGFKDQKREIYINKSDFHINNDSNLLDDIEFNLFFKINDEFEKACFIELYNPKNDCLELNFRYNLNTSAPIERINYKIWGGENEGQNISNEVFQLFYHVYLGALRDARRHLHPGRNSKLAQFFSKIDSKELSHDFDKDEMIKSLNEAIKDEKIFEFIEKAKKEYISTHLTETTIDDIDIDIKFLPHNFEDFVEKFKILLPYSNETGDLEQKYLELHQNGLGYNNLIYISILLGDLKDLNKIEKGSYVSLLVEEPEAHLHPQLQNLFFNYLNELNKELNTEKNQGFQIFVSSHSPTLTAKSDLDSLIILQNFNNSINNISMKNSNLSLDNKKYLLKFLDVTKSQLFFAKSVILVEGISEALLLPILGEILGYNFDKQGVEVVNVNGLSFKHFIPLFSKNINFENNTTKNILTSRCSIVTDDDRKNLFSRPSNTFKSLKKTEDINLRVFGGMKTFEFALFNASNKNIEILTPLYKKVHPTMGKKFSEKIKGMIYKEQFIFNNLKIKEKSEFAWELSMLLNSESEVKNKFKVPNYIVEAIEFAIGKND